MPGPSTGDAAEHIESLGFDPWSFAELEIVSESDHDGIVTTEFSITGLAATLSALRGLFDSARFLGFGMVARDTRKPILDGGQICRYQVAATGLQVISEPKRLNSNDFRTPKIEI